MTYQVLARKWRPKTFTDMVGQEHVLKALINALNQGRLHHAYLFTGTRGVGKTTIARILAKCLNCETTAVMSQPCGQCSACQAIDAGRFVDLIEVDAASRTKVEDTRELLENVQYAATSGRYKVYLIDEVHMLSGHSFNALLKTLEEPPSHVKFLLATTDPQKLPITVLSRCLQFNLKNLSPELIQQQLAFVLTQEHLPFEIPALQELAHAADGSMRDGLSLLDQAIAYGNGEVKTADVLQMLGAIAKDQIYAILTALHQQDAEALLVLTSQLAEQGTDFNNALESLLSSLHQLAVAQQVPTSNIVEPLQTLSQQFSAEDIQLFYQIALIGRRDLPLAPSPKIGFDMVLLRMLAFRPGAQQKIAPFQNTTPAENIPRQRNSQPQSTVGQTHPSTTEDLQQKIPVNNQDLAKTSNIDENNEPPKVSSEIESACHIPSKVTEKIESFDWPTLLSKLNLTGMAYALASHSALKSHTENHIILELEPSQAPLLNPNQQQRIQQALELYYNTPVKLAIEIASANILSPAKQKQQLRDMQQQAAVKAIESDTHIQSLLQGFNATLDPESIQPLAIEET